jgi:pimeloyl-ACP methyl ester carboxylesterase
MTEQRFATDGGQINYVQGGSGTRPLVILHGLTLNLQSMAEIITPLDALARWYACDLPGHGKSDWSESGYRISDYADGIAPFVTEISGSGTVLIGYSLSAVVVLEIAARLPELVAGVVAIDPPLILRNSDFDATAYSDAYGWIHWVNDLNGGRLTFAQAVARFTELHPGAGEAEAREAMSVVSSVDPRATQRVVASGIYEDFDIERTLHGVACPILLLVGEVELGGQVRDQDVELVSAYAPSARVVQILGGGHNLVSDEPPETVHAEIIDFLKSLPLTPRLPGEQQSSPETGRGSNQTPLR